MNFPEVKNMNYALDKTKKQPRIDKNLPPFGLKFYVTLRSEAA